LKIKNGNNFGIILDITLTRNHFFPKLVHPHVISKIIPKLLPFFIFKNIVLLNHCIDFSLCGSTMGNKLALSPVALIQPIWKRVFH
jgi:hypothetical protein